MIEIEKPNITTVNLSEDGTRGKFIGQKTKQGLGRYLGVEGLPRIFRGKDEED